MALQNICWRAKTNKLLAVVNLYTTVNYENENKYIKQQSYKNTKLYKSSVVP